MILKTITVSKEFKVGLPNYSNITASASLTFDLSPDELVNWDSIWDQLNQQLAIQSDNIDPCWINTKEYKNFFTTTIKNKKINDVKEVS